MKIIPYDHFLLYSSLPSEEVTGRLSAVTECCEIGFLCENLKDTACEFYGIVKFGEFRLIKKITYRNSFNPIIRGTIFTEDEKTVIDVRMSLIPFVAVFIAFWLFFASVFTVLGLCFEAEKVVLLHPIVMIIVCYCTVEGGFWYEAKRIRRRLESLCQSH